MSAYVLDASVAAKWFLKDEPLAEESAHFLDQFAAGHNNICVPDLFWLELGNIGWKAVRVGRTSVEVAEKAIRQLLELGIATSPTKQLLPEALSIAMAFQRTVYDSIYVALAVALNRLLITADERLANALGAYFPVRWLGAAATY